MRGPLISILGYSQVILSKNPEKEVVDSADSILRETRAARSVLDKVLLYAGEEVKEKHTMKLEGPLARALKSLEFVFLNKGVKLHKTFESVTPIDLNVDALSKAFEHILTNSVEAMERMNGKEIRLKLTEDDHNIILVIEDTGEGIDAKNLDKIFDPFFTTRTFQNHMGLGLSVALGVLKEHGAQVSVTSERARGTKFQILFKKPEAAQTIKIPATPKIAQDDKVEVEQQLPQLKDIKVLAAPAKSDDSEEVDEYQSVSHFRLPSTPEEIEQDTIYPISKVDSDVTPPQFKEQTKTDLIKQPVTPILDEERTVTTSSPLDVNIENLFELPSAQEVIAAAQTAKPARPLPPAGATSIPGELDDMDSFNKIVGPRGLSASKSSKLDDYPVEIRRPGKRT
jgi:two-component system NtrC family sensor kinase